MEDMQKTFFRLESSKYVGFPINKENKLLVYYL